MPVTLRSKLKTPSGIFTGYLRAEHILRPTETANQEDERENIHTGKPVSSFSSKIASQYFTIKTHLIIFLLKHLIYSA